MKVSLLPTLLLLSASNAAFCPPNASDAASQTSIFATFVKRFYVDKSVRTAFMDHVSESYIQHNPSALSGRQVAIDALSGIVPSVKYTIMHQGVVNGTGYVHYRMDYSGSSPTAVVDVFRFDGGCIMEHWDVAQARPNNPTNPLAMW
jgi:predicted SnoaL-like aldol condensation-catalyzing enzyme